jgi:restriction system protein
MPLWVVRAGKHGEQEEAAVKEGLVCHAWNELPDYSACHSKHELRALYVEAYPHETERQVISGVSQTWRFAHEIQKGNLVALPLKKEAAFEFGWVTGDYEYKAVAPNVKHIRAVKWIKAVPRSGIPQDILISMNSSLTVFGVSRNDAEARLSPILAPPTGASAELEVGAEPGDREAIDVEETARDGIIKFIQCRFKGHDLTRLVEAVLKAQGYATKMSPPGPDAGVDIFAGSGPFGMDQPRLCVQVKSGNNPEGQGTFNELLGAVSKFDSEQGLLVSWGGFTNPVKLDARKHFFKIRLWNQGDLVSALVQNYERLDDEIKAELPLKRIWAVVDEDID